MPPIYEGSLLTALIPKGTQFPKTEKWSPLQGTQMEAEESSTFTAFYSLLHQAQDFYTFTSKVKCNFQGALEFVPGLGMKGTIGRLTFTYQPWLLQLSHPIQSHHFELYMRRLQEL